MPGDRGIRSSIRHGMFSGSVVHFARGQVHSGDATDVGLRTPRRRT